MAEVALAFVAVPLTVYVPLAAEVGDVTCIVVEALAPGAIERLLAPSATVQPEGALAPRLKLEAVQGETSLFVTVTVYVTLVPAATLPVAELVTPTDGLTCVHVGGGGPLKVTVTDAPAELTELVVMDTPESGSVYVCPAASAGSPHEEVAGVMSRRSLLSA